MKSLIILLVVCGVCLSGCGTNKKADLESLVSDDVNTSFMVIGLGPNSKYIDRLVFRNVVTETEYKLKLKKRQGGALVLPVPAGEYYLSRLDMVFEDLSSVYFDKPETLLKIRDDSINYLGDLSWDEKSCYVDYVKNTMILAVRENKERFGQRDVYILNAIFGDPSVKRVTPTLNDTSEMMLPRMM